MIQLKCKCGVVLGETDTERDDYGVHCPACYEADAPKRERAEAFAFLASTDHLMPRAFEDAVEAGLIDVTKLPQAAQGRYSARQAARARLAASAG